MGSPLTGNTVSSTYTALLKTSDTSAVTTTLKTISDGSGNDSALQLSTTAVNTTGNFSVATDKLTVASATGNTAAAGTLACVGNFAVNTNKFSVLAASGNTTVAGTLSVAGAVSLSGGDLTTNNRIILNGNYGISQNAAAASNLFVAPTTFNGLATFTGGMQFQSAVNMTDDLTVAGVTTLNGNVVLGNAAGDSITVTGTPTFAQTATFNGIANFNGNVALGSDASDALTVNAVSTFVGNASFNGNTTIGSDATDTLTVNAAFNPATVTYDPADFVLIQDASDSNKIKKATVASVFGKKYTSAEYAIPTSEGSIVNNANILNDTHQLGGVPDIIQAFLVCQYAYDGFSVGDVITMDYAFSGTYSPPIQLIANSSNVIANMTTWNGLFDAFKANGNLIGGVRVDSYPDRWKIKVVAIKFG